MKQGKGRIYQRGEIWYVDAYVNGQRVRKAVGGKSQSMELLKEIKKSSILEELGIDLPERKKRIEIKFNELCCAYLEFAESNHKSFTFKRELEIVRNHLAPYFKDLPLVNLTPKVIETFKQKRLLKVKPVTVYTELKVLSSMMSKAVIWYDLQGNPLSKVDKVKLTERNPVFMEAEEVRRFLSACDPSFYPLVATFLYAGLRRTEAFKLEKSDLDFTHNTIHIRAEVSKNGKPRYIPMHPELRKILTEQVKLNPESDYVFPGMDGVSVRVTCQGAFRKTKKRAKINPRLRLHDLRHTWASNLLEAGVNPMQVKEWGGWHSIKMLDIYAHTTQSKKKADVAIAKLDYLVT